MYSLALTEPNEPLGENGSSLLSVSMTRSKLLYSMLLNGQNKQTSERTLAQSPKPHLFVKVQKDIFNQASPLKTKKFGLNPNGQFSLETSASKANNNLKKIPASQTPFKISSPCSEPEQSIRTSRTNSPRGPQKQTINKSKPFGGTPVNLFNEAPQLQIPNQKKIPSSMQGTKSLGDLQLDHHAFSQRDLGKMPASSKLVLGSTFKKLGAREGSPVQCDPIHSQNQKPETIEVGKSMGLARLEAKVSPRSGALRDALIAGKLDSKKGAQGSPRLIGNPVKVNNFF
jgi:hypothetical protein